MNDTRKPIAQGDALFVPVCRDATGEAIAPIEGHYIVAHSETGHNHVIEAEPRVRMFKGMDAFRDLLFIEGDAPVEVKHLRDHHTHATVMLAPGAWEVRRQREYDPMEGFRRAQD